MIFNERMAMRRISQGCNLAVWIQEDEAIGGGARPRHLELRARLGQHIYRQPLNISAHPRRGWVIRSSEGDVGEAYGCERGLVYTGEYPGFGDIYANDITKAYVGDDWEDTGVIFIIRVICELTSCLDSSLHVFHVDIR